MITSYSKKHVILLIMSYIYVLCQRFWSISDLFRNSNPYITIMYIASYLHIMLKEIIDSSILYEIGIYA